MKPPRKTSGEQRIGLVACPACKDAVPDAPCALCHGVRMVTVDAAIEWRVARDSELPGKKPESE